MKTERIRITQSCRGSADGFTVLNFEPDGGAGKDGIYEVAASLAAAFCDEQKTAERVGLAGVADKVADVVTSVADVVTGAVAAAKTKGKAAKGKAAAADDEPAPDAPAEG